MESLGKGVFASQKQNKQVRLQSNLSFWLRLIEFICMQMEGKKKQQQKKSLPGCINLFIQNSTSAQPEQHFIRQLCSTEFLGHVSYSHPIIVACKVNHLYVKFTQTRKPKQSISLFSSTNQVKYKQTKIPRMCGEHRLRLVSQRSDRLQ